jgi:hypothetical protein
MIKKGAPLKGGALRAWDERYAWRRGKTSGVYKGIHGKTTIFARNFGREPRWRAVFRSTGVEGRRRHLASFGIIIDRVKPGTDLVGAVTVVVSYRTGYSLCSDVFRAVNLNILEKVELSNSIISH